MSKCKLVAMVGMILISFPFPILYHISLTNVKAIFTFFDLFSFSKSVCESITLSSLGICFISFFLFPFPILYHISGAVVKVKQLFLTIFIKKILKNFSGGISENLCSCLGVSSRTSPSIFTDTLYNCPFRLSPKSKNFS